MPLDDDDYQLSMKVSRKAIAEENNVGLRSLIIHRLTITMKLIGRRAMRSGSIGHYCENCDNWFRLNGFPEVTQCPHCDAVYRMELAVYEQLDEDPRG